jgi:hypothetical protein
MPSRDARSRCSAAAPRGCVHLHSLCAEMPGCARMLPTSPLGSHASAGAHLTMQTAPLARSMALNWRGGRPSAVHNMERSRLLWVTTRWVDPG